MKRASPRVGASRVLHLDGVGGSSDTDSGIIDTPAALGVDPTQRAAMPTARPRPVYNRRQAASDHGAAVVTQQPQSQKRGLPQGVVDIHQRTQLRDALERFDKIQIEHIFKWSYNNVVANFLGPLDLEEHGPTFIYHRVNGKVLFGLGKDDLRDMIPKDEVTAMPIGHRNLMMSVINYLKKRKKHWDSDRVVWKVTTPSGGWQYHRDMFHFLGAACCPWFVPKRHFKLTPTNLVVRHEPPGCNLCCGGTKIETHNLRFMKDVDYDWSVICWCWKYRTLHLTFEGSAGGATTSKEVQHIDMAHPTVGKGMVDELNFLWGNSRLVAML